MPGQKLTESWRISEFSLSSRDMLAVGVGNGTVRLFDFKNGKYLTTLPKRDEDDKPITGIEFSPNGKWLAYFNNDRLHMVDVDEYYPKESDVSSDAPGDDAPAAATEEAVAQ